MAFREVRMFGSVRRVGEEERNFIPARVSP